MLGWINHSCVTIAGILIAFSLKTSQAASQPALDSPFRHADVRGTVGEAGSLHLLHDTIYIHPLNNDLAGRTDKHLTHSTKLGITGHFDDGDGYDLRLGWRFITPEYTNLGEQLGETTQAIGRYGDWAEIQTARALGFVVGDGLLRVQFSVGLGHLGPKGAKEVQVNLHKQLDNAWTHLVWLQEQQGLAASTGINIGFAPSRLAGDWFVFDNMASIALNNTLVMTDASLVTNHIVSFNESFKIALETKIVRQFTSVIYGDRIKKWRGEASFGVLVTRWYKPTINYVTDYLRGDDIPQFYLDFLNLNVPL